MNQRILTALPVFNEASHVCGVLDQVVRYSPHVLVVDDGSSDGTAELLAARSDITVVTHAENQGYGAALLTAFRYAIEHEFDVLVTIDCDGQHQPQRIPQFVTAINDTTREQPIDIVSGSRYLSQLEGDSQPPVERMRINQIVTAELNSRLGLNLTDAFCGFKAYRVASLPCLVKQIHETGYAMPLEVWVEVAKLKLNVVELAVPLIYLDEKRSFGGALDDGQTRLDYYRLILNRGLAAIEEEAGCDGDRAVCCKDGR
ncbi:MAG: glycosyltransferase family 2 protein [Planctomycetes bacterium]|nr:glycosyltransferase family 2 protein [Planctomycetota bacterium]